jgi:hypothetical protein
VAHFVARGVGEQRPRFYLGQLYAPPGRVYTNDMTISTERPEFEADDIAQAVSVGVCLVLAVVLLASAISRPSIR